MRNLFSAMDLEFPIEIWKQILCHLDKEHLKQCLLISNEFRDMIIKTPQLMRKLQVIFFNDGWEAKLRFIEEYGFFVRSIKFDDCGFRAIQDVKKILELTPNVETLIFYNCYFLEPHDELHHHEVEHGDHENNPEHPPELVRPLEINVMHANPTEARFELTENDDDEPLELPKLTFLHLDSCNIAEKLVHNLRTCRTLKSFKVTFYYQTPVNFFTDFICQQNHLEELFCVGWSDMVFKSLFKDDISHDQVSFKLRKFTLECELSYHENFSKFLRSQAQHIEELELICYNINFHYYRLLFNNFHRLKKLTLPTDWFLTDERAIEIENCRIPSLKELDLVGSNDDVTTFEVVLKIFPSIEVLRAENIMHFAVHEVLSRFTKLRHIKAENFRVELMMNLKLPSLKVLEIAYLYPICMSLFWEKLAEDCGNIEQLIVKDIGNLKLNASIRKEIGIIVRNLANFKKLKYCEVISSPQELMVNGDHDQNEIHPPHEHPFYKVIVENFPGKQRVLKISQYFAQHCTDDVNALKEIFSKCDILEI